MSFLKLHYAASGQAFLINTASIAGVEMNGTPDKGCVLTLAFTDHEGAHRVEVIAESFEAVERALNATTIV